MNAALMFPMDLIPMAIGLTALAVILAIAIRLIK